MVRRRIISRNLPEDPFPQDEGERRAYQVRSTRSIALPPNSRQVYNGGDRVLLTEERARSYASVFRPVEEVVVAKSRTGRTRMVDTAATANRGHRESAAPSRAAAPKPVARVTRASSAKPAPTQPKRRPAPVQEMADPLDSDE